MSYKQYKIANCTIAVTQADKLDSAWNLFQSTKQEDIDLFVQLTCQLGGRYGVDIFPPQPGLSVLKCRNVLLSTNAEWTKTSLIFLNEKGEGLSGALSALVTTHLAKKHALMIHSSLIETNGKGILFVGPSDIGKTTQAELWNQYRKACIINGDMAIIRREGACYVGYGCPWHGSSVYCENKQVPLVCIVVLEKSTTNQICRLHGIKMVERVMRNVLLPYWDEHRVVDCCDTVDDLLSQIPVYLLKCRPDEAAVTLLAQELERLE